jgi:hypothetical protein
MSDNHCKIMELHCWHELTRAQNSWHLKRWPRRRAQSSLLKNRPQLGGSWGRSLEVPVRAAGTISYVVSRLRLDH